MIKALRMQKASLKKHTPPFWKEAYSSASAANVTATAAQMSRYAWRDTKTCLEFQASAAQRHQSVPETPSLLDICKRLPSRTLRFIFSTMRPLNMSSSMDLASLKTASFSNCSPAKTMQGYITHSSYHHPCLQSIHTSLRQCGLHADAQLYCHALE